MPISAPPIRLRGHHLESFIEFIAWHKAKPKWSLRKRDERYLDEYGEAFIESKHRLFEQLMQNPETKILIVEDEFDALCNSGCMSKEMGCINPNGYDQYIAHGQGYEVRRTYITKEIIDRVKI